MLIQQAVCGLGVQIAASLAPEKQHPATHVGDGTICTNASRGAVYR
jgi:hypothetical protein